MKKIFINKYAHNICNKLLFVRSMNGSKFFINKLAQTQCKTINMNGIFLLIFKILKHVSVKHQNW